MADSTATSPTEVAGSQVTGLEAELVRAFAEELGTSVIWFAGGEESLLAALENYDLDLVVGNLSEKTPWGRRVGLTKAYVSSGAGQDRRRHVWAVAPGENGFLMRTEIFLETSRPLTLRLAEELGLASVREPE